MKSLNEEPKIQEKYPEFESFSEIENFLKQSHTIRSEFKMHLLMASTDAHDDIIEDFQQKFQVSKREFMHKIKKYDEEKKETVFLGYLLFPLDLFENDLFHFERGLIDKNISFLIVLTFSTSEQVRSHFFTHFLNKSKLIDSLWITHKLTIDLIDQFKMKDTTNIRKIEGYYLPLFEEKPSQRPDFYRKISYEGGDALRSYYELKSLYGINVELFSGIIDYNEFNFKRNQAIISFKKGDLVYFIDMGIWIFTKASEYLTKVRKFKKQHYKSIYLKRHYLLNNNLFIKFGRELSNDVIDEIIKTIKGTQEIEILSKISREDYYNYENIIDKSDESYTRLKVVNKEKQGIFIIEITPKMAEISQVFQTNYIGVFPLLDILDYTHPQNEITIIEN